MISPSSYHNSPPESVVLGQFVHKITGKVHRFLNSYSKLNRKSNRLPDSNTIGELIHAKISLRPSFLCLFRPTKNKLISPPQSAVPHNFHYSCRKRPLSSRFLIRNCIKILSKLHDWIHNQQEFFSLFFGRHLFFFISNSTRICVLWAHNLLNSEV